MEQMPALETSPATCWIANIETPIRPCRLRANDRPKIAFGRERFRMEGPPHQGYR